MLESIRGPRDLDALSPGELDVLATEIRALLVDNVTSTGGHLGPNLGVVELMLALHCEFDSPNDRIVFDTGHQSYVHKILTGRAGDFDQLRRRGGLSGYPARKESSHDLVENSHASTALSYADGLSRALSLAGDRDRRVVAVVGDGAMTGGMAWEALNNVAVGDRSNLIVVVNDNGRSYAPTVGGLAEHLGALRSGSPQGDSRERDAAALHTIFTSLGLRYLGPIDGHDVTALRCAFRIARDRGEAVVVHCVTRKGAGYPPAERDEADRFHGVGSVDPPGSSRVAHRRSAGRCDAACTAPRGVGGRGRPDAGALPQGSAARGYRRPRPARGSGRTGRTRRRQEGCAAGVGRRDGADLPDDGEAADRGRLGGDRGGPGLGQADRRGTRNAGRRAPPGGDGRGRRPGGRCRFRSRSGAARGGGGRAATGFRNACTLLEPRHPWRAAGGVGADGGAARGRSGEVLPEAVR